MEFNNNKNYMKMNKTKELLQRAITTIDKNPFVAAMIIRKALKQLEEHNIKKSKEMENELSKPDILLGKVF